MEYPTITFANNCSTLDFDGIDDNVTFRNQYNLTSPFSIEIWVKPSGANALGNDQTIISKRSDNDRSTGYDLSLKNNILSFNWNSTGTISSPYAMGTSRWYHVAVIFDGSTYRLYVDGIQVNSAAGTAPVSNSYECIMGAMDQTATPPFKPLNYYHGWTDELRIWNVALSDRQIRHILNSSVQP